MSERAYFVTLRACLRLLSIGLCTEAELGWWADQVFKRPPPSSCPPPVEYGRAGRDSVTSKLALPLGALHPPDPSLCSFRPNVL